MIDGAAVGFVGATALSTGIGVAEAGIEVAVSVTGCSVDRGVAVTTITCGEQAVRVRIKKQIRNFVFMFSPSILC
jgi:hypothetical protein